MKKTLFVVALVGLVALGAAVAQAPDGPRGPSFDFVALGASALLFGAAFVAPFVAAARKRFTWLVGERITLLAGAVSILGAFGLYQGGVLTDPDYTRFPPPWTWLGFGGMSWVVASGGYDLVRSLFPPRPAPPVVSTVYTLGSAPSAPSVPPPSF